MSQSSGNASAKTGGAKPRSPAELIIVRGGILVLFALVAVEGWGWMGWKNAVTTLTAKMKAVDETKDAVPVKLSL